MWIFLQDPLRLVRFVRFYCPRANLRSGLAHVQVRLLRFAHATIASRRWASVLVADVRHSPGLPRTRPLDALRRWMHNAGIGASLQLGTPPERPIWKSKVWHGGYTLRNVGRGRF